MPFFVDLDDRFNDYWRYQIAQKSQPDNDILIIEIDDKSLIQLEPQIGRWPWPRSIHAFLNEGLIAAQAKVIIFDILFSEKDLYQPDSDEFFSQSLDASDNIFFSAALLSKNSLVEPIDIGLLPENIISYSNPINPQKSMVNINLPWAIESSHWNIGLIDFFADHDGVARRYPLVVDRDGTGLYSLAKRVFDYLELKKNHKIKPILNNVVNLNYRGVTEIPFNSLPYADAKYYLDNNLNTEYFKNKIVIIGPTATGLHDLRASPILKRYPATSILATAIDNLLNNDFLILVSRYKGLMLLLFLTSLLWFMTHYVNSYKNQLLASSCLLIVTVVLLYLVSYQNSLVNKLFPSASILTLLLSSIIIILFYRGLKEYLSRQYIQQTFSRFMDPQIVKQLVNDEEWQQKTANKSTQVSVLFSDIRGFTTMSETRSAEEIIKILNQYFDLQVEIIFETKGTLDKFIGDAIMAFWGAPIDDEEHAKNAVKAALLMAENLIEFRKSLPDDLKAFDVGIGVHSGEAVVGMLGCSKRFDYTAIGDTVNLASRIEGVTKGVARVLVSEATKKLCESDFEFEYCGEFAVKGRSEKVKLYQPKLLT